MSLKKYVKYTSLGLALSISAITFAPSMSSAQVETDSVGTSIVQKNSHYHYTPSKAVGYEENEKRFKFNFGALEARIYAEDVNYSDVVHLFKKDFEIIKNYEKKYGIQITMATLNFVLDMIEHHDSLREIYDAIDRYIRDLPHIYETEQYGEALKGVVRAYEYAKGR
ncbi:hypothetical protein [Bacillus wiedmannii]|uniref:hypothetical protein n=1 Tax=Bacillus wiedmannii TaxID=1890302 RepID=UPI000BEC859A|nr:hypothetical protein [Bacillus wiedmannii]PEF34039.1 hypothetical protein CON72_21720 [Bacillus wiedmannii]